MKRIDFFIVGVNKGGTTALDSHLRHCFGVQMARRKELHFFDDERRDWSSPDYTDLHKQFDWNAPNVVRGEATPKYCFWPGSIARIHDYNPDAKLIFCLRHPTFRAFSSWRHNAKAGRDQMSFEDAIGEPGRSIAQLFPARAYVARGRYAHQIERALEWFPREQMHFIRTDRLWSDHNTTLAALLDFLGVARSEIPLRQYVVPMVSRGLAELTTAARRELDLIYSEDILRTAAITGLNLSDWLDPNYSEPMPA